MIDPYLESLWKAAFLALAEKPPDLIPLGILGDFFEEHGHMGSAHGCRQSRPWNWCPPILSFLEDVYGLTGEESKQIRFTWAAEAKLNRAKATL